MKKAIVPQATVRHFGLGQHCIDSIEGDLILVKHSGWSARLIRLGQRVRYFMLREISRNKEFEKIFTEKNHAMIVVVGNGEAKVSQMEPRGGRVVSLQDYADLEYWVVHPVGTTQEQRDIVVQFGLWTEGIEYGWFSILGMSADVFMPIIELSLGSGNRMVCSTQASLAHRCFGLVPDKNDTGLFPADLARYYNVR